MPGVEEPLASPCHVPLSRWGTEAQKGHGTYSRSHGNQGSRQARMLAQPCPPLALVPLSGEWGERGPRPHGECARPLGLSERDQPGSVTVETYFHAVLETKVPPGWVLAGALPACRGTFPMCSGGESAHVASSSYRDAKSVLTPLKRTTH